MKNESATILVVDDDREMVAFLCDILQEENYIALKAHTGAEALALVEREAPDLVISDLRMSGMTGHALQNELRRVAPEIPIIIITAFGSIESAVESIKLGAFDYITKPFANQELLLVIERALENRQLRLEIKRLRGELARSYGVGNIIAASPTLRDVLRRIEQIASSGASVLLTGESGTGKDLLARALHYQSQRRDYPFIAVNCAAIPEHLIESELFGYVRGAFTDARQSRIGLFQAAAKGTLFLDEIGEMPLTLQVKLLRVIEEKRVRPLGGNEEVPVDVRIVAATNADLETAMAHNRFRSDLYYRIAMFVLPIPPLRERPEDLPLLIKQFTVRAAAEAGKPTPAITPEAMDCLRHYSWPGNVRELQNAVHSAVILSHEGTVTMDDLPPKVGTRQNTPLRMLEEAAVHNLSLAAIERKYIYKVLASVGGNKTEAAAILQIDRKTLYRKLVEEADLPSPPDEESAS
ncbi:MAG TPA: sigma-54 dependent transcriptional regulator [Candidatus Binataceae bacterium]|nr:sigma-54 dependent transcriptional regulator [Candidatus Binataceae bacterium]